MQSYYYLLLVILSFSVPFLFSFERKRMHFIQYWKAFFFGHSLGRFILHRMGYLFYARKSLGFQR